MISKEMCPREEGLGVGREGEGKRLRTGWLSPGQPQADSQVEPQRACRQEWIEEQGDETSRVPRPAGKLYWAFTGC